MNLRNRPVRLVAAVGAVLAAGTTTFMALAAGTASADEPGRCTQNVNVREDPNAHAKIVALCEAGKQVKIGEERDGWVRLDELDGWASKDYVKADDDAASSESSADDAHHSADDASDRNDNGSDSNGSDNNGDNSSSSDNGSDNGNGGRSSGSSDSTGSTGHTGGGTPGGGELGGLLG